MGIRVYLAEVQYRNIGTATLEKLYLATHTITPFLASDPDRPNQIYDPVLKSTAEFTIRAFGKGRTFGRSEAAEGRLRWSNISTDYDFLMLDGYAWDGYNVDIYINEDYQRGDSFSTFSKVTSGKIEHLGLHYSPEENGGNDVEVIFRDRQLLFEELIQGTARRYTGAGTTFGGADIQGKPWPIAYGNPTNFAPPVVNGTNLYFQLSDYQCEGIDWIKDNGVSLTPGTQRTTLSALIAASPGASTFDYYLGDDGDGLWIKLGSTPAGQITAKVKGISRTNVALRSQEFDNATWTKTNVTVSANNAVAPDGTTTMDKLVATATNGVHTVDQTYTVRSGKVYWTSFFFKAAGYSRVEIQLVSTSTWAKGFDLSTGAMFTATVSGSAPSDAIIEDCGNGVYRCAMKVTTGTTTLQAKVYIQNGSTTSFAGDATSGVQAWGAQCEIRDLCWYLATTTASVTSALNSTAEIIDHLVRTRALYTEIDMASLWTYQVAWSAAMDVYRAEDEPFSNLFDRLVLGGLGAWWFARDGYYTLGRLTDPSAATPVATFTKADLFSVQREAMDDAQSSRPMYEAVVAYAENYMVQQWDGVNAAIAHLQFIKERFRDVKATDATTKVDHVLAVSQRFETALRNQADAQTLADAIVAFYKHKRDYISIVIEDVDAQFYLLDCVEIELDRWGWDSGKKWRVLGVGEAQPAPGWKRLELYA